MLQNTGPRVLRASTGLVVLQQWGLPGPGIEPVSPALQGRFLTTRPPGKPLNFILTANGEPLKGFRKGSDLVTHGF